MPTFDQVFLAADYSFGHIARSPDIETLYHSLKKDGTPLILDLGANIGLSALYFSKNWPDCHVLAVEPDDDNDRMLQRNIAGHGNIRAIKAAVANKDGAVTIVNPDGTAWAYQTREVDEPTDSSIPSKSVPTLLKMAAPADKPCKPFVVKIDIEGFEENLFAQNADWIALFPIIWVELHDWLRPRSGLSHNFICQIAKGNWDILLVGENIACISNDPRWSAHMNALSRP